MANRAWQVGLGLAFLAALASNPVGCGGGAGSSNCGGVANPCTEHNATRCNETKSSIQTCLPDTDGCFVWTDSTSCGDNEVCDETSGSPSCVAGSGCGDGTCDTVGGETPENCPQDCDQPCVAPVDCLALEWDAGCEGRWDCVEQACVEVCDYDSCGDDLCSAADGENDLTCPRDCREGCEVPSDCYLEQWGMICQGRWNCFQGECQEVCSSANCPDGVCWGLNGENEDSCFRDCLGGPCLELTDCFAHRWYEDFGGHWQCNPADPPLMLSTGACEAVEDAVGCGDGSCDVLGGETPIACVADCSDYSCTRSDDCDALTLPGSCSSWICSSLVCVPQQCD